MLHEACQHVNFQHRTHGRRLLRQSNISFFSELCWGITMVVYTKHQQRKKEESKRLRGERDQIKFIDLGFERWQVVRFRKERGRQDVPEMFLG